MKYMSNLMWKVFTELLKHTYSVKHTIKNKLFFKVFNIGFYFKHLVYCIVFYVLIAILLLSTSAIIMKSALYQVNKVIYNTIIEAQNKHACQAPLVLSSLRKVTLHQQLPM